MAREQEETPRGHRLVALGAVALLSLATSVAFGRVFAGHVPTLKLAAAALGSTALAALMERRSSLLSALVSAAGLFVAVGWLVFPHSLYFGVPAARTVSAIGRAIGHISQQAATQVAPTPPVRPLLLAALTAAWTAAFSTHALAIRSGSPLLAAIPSVALFTFAGIVVGDGPRPAYAAFFLVALFAMLFSDGLRRVRQWGPLRPWGVFGKRRLTSPTATRGARRVTVAAIGVAILLPGLLPGYRSGSILDVGKGGGGGIQVDPLVSINASLKNNNPVPLFLVRSQTPPLTYWRWLSEDQFDGVKWNTPDLNVEHGVTVGSGVRLPTSPFNDLAIGKDGFPLAATTEVTQDVEILNPPGQWLPAAYRPEAISLADGQKLRYDPTIEAAVPDTSAGIQAGFTYRVTSRVVDPSFSQLDKVTYDLSDPALRRFTQLPDRTLREMQPLADQIAAGQPTPYRQVLAIQNYFTRSGLFTYDTHVPGRNDTDFLVRFIATTRRGFCQQFATAMAVLVRALGYPARIAVGYTPGTFDPSVNAYRVTSANAHAWVEVLFPGYGWLPFEPTPGPGNPLEPGYFNPPVKATDGSAGCDDRTTQQHDCTRAGGTTTNGQPSNQQDANRPVGGAPPGNIPLLTTVPGHHRHRSHPTSLKLLALLALAALVGAVLVLLPIAKLVGRRVRLRRAHSPREVVLAVYDVFSSRAADLGLGRDPGETLWEYDLRIRRDVRFSDGHLDRLTGMAGRAAYAGGAVTENQAREAGQDARAAIRDMRREAPAYRRIAGWWRPSL
ncbi:MAG: DUF3488 and transglutaminase-like domain-containing protein [Actinomycetota bacterium]|nr:DUF3488 and transglutaminase-like domain-containing protein [Actinomycetota bacterium]